MDPAMMKYKCKICEGTYSDQCTDGLDYFHSCPIVIDKDGNTKEHPNKRDENIKELKSLDQREQIS